VARDAARHATLLYGERLAKRGLVPAKRAERAGEFKRLPCGHIRRTELQVMRKKGDQVAEQHTEQTIRVRQVTDVQVSWTERGRGEHGAFTVQLILDSGAEEYVLQPTAEDTKVMVELFKRANTVYFDLDRKVLVPNNIPLGR
jgi:hypothetical protein